MRLRHLRRGGPYFRVADPSWQRPLEGRHAADHGGRWNSPGSFPIVYLCATREVARANILRRFAGQPYSDLDIDPSRRPVLVETDVPEHRAVDITSGAGFRAAGLPSTYPLAEDGTEVPWSMCQVVGSAAWEQDERSIACISATRAGEELAWFARGRALKVRRSRDFADWFPAP